MCAGLSRVRGGTGRQRFGTATNVLGLLLGARMRRFRPGDGPAQFPVSYLTPVPLPGGDGRHWDLTAGAERRARVPRVRAVRLAVRNLSGRFHVLAEDVRVGARQVEALYESVELYTGGEIVAGAAGHSDHRLH